MTGLSPGSCHDRGISEAPGRIPELDALRGIAALLVLLHHVFVIFSDEVRAAVSKGLYQAIDVVQAQNGAAVLLFFVISGFAIGMATRDRPPVNRPALRYYAHRRARRILPLYYFSLAWTAMFGVLYGLDRDSFSWATLFGNALFLQTSASAPGTWFVPYGDNGPYWSLSYEAFFYLTLPAVLYLVQHSPLANNPGPALIGIGISSCFAGLALSTFAPSPFALFFGYWIVWLLGYAVVGMEPRLRSTVLIVAPVAITGGALMVLAIFGYSSDTLEAVFKGCVFAAVFCCIALYPAWMGATVIRLLRRTLVLLFGRIGKGSYALYLLHYPLLLGLNELFEKTAGVIPFWSLLIVLLAFSTMFCPWLERVLMLPASSNVLPQKPRRTL